MSNKEKYHTFENENRKAEVYKSKPAWLVECFEDGSNVHQTIFGTESKAELYADDWVLKNERTRISN